MPDALKAATDTLSVVQGSNHILRFPGEFAELPALKGEETQFDLLQRTLYAAARRDSAKVWASRNTLRARGVDSTLFGLSNLFVWSRQQ